MKKTNNIFLIIVVVLLIAIFITVFLILNNNIRTFGENQINYVNRENNASLSDDSYYGYSLYSDYIDDIDSNKNIIKNYSELQEFCDKYNHYTYDGYGNIKSGTLDELLTKYNDNFFENKSLAIEYVQLGSGSASVKFINATRIGNSVNINYDINYDGIGVMSMSGYLIIVEVDSDIIDIITK